MMKDDVCCILKRVYDPNITITYTVDNQWCVDIVITPDVYESWLYRKGYGIKSFMFGMPKAQQSYDKYLEHVSSELWEFYIPLYEEDYMNDDDYDI